MLLPDAYFVDLNVIYTLLYKNIWYIIKLLLVAYGIFYYLPSKIFPQEQIKSGVQKVVFNFIYMTAYIEIVVTFLIFIKAFSLLFFLLILILTKLAFMKYYYKQDVMKIIDDMRIEMMLKSLDILDNTDGFKKKIKYYIHEKIVNLQYSITFYTLFEKTLFYSVFIYIFIVLIARGLLSYSDPLPDTAQFMEWVAFLQQNILYADNKTFGADFYGISVLIFFVNVFTNIDQIILFSIYPLLLLIALYASIYYVVKDFTSSKYTALFAVMFHGIILMSPLSDVLLGVNVTTASPEIIKIFGLNFYMPSLTDTSSTVSNYVGISPYIRYITGMAYEHASVFVLLNAYFLIKTLQTQYIKYLILYALTLMLVFIFHGGGAIVLIVISILIALNALLFKKVDKTILKKGLLAILFATIFGNFWILSMIKYGIPPEFGAAAPFLDKILKTKGLGEVTKVDIYNVSIIGITYIQLTFFIGLSFAFLSSFFTKEKFLNISYLLIVLGIFIVYFGPNAGVPLLTKQYRVADYMFFALTLLSSFYFFYFVHKPLLLLFKKYYRYIILFLYYILLLFSILVVPRWTETNFFWESINRIQYTSIPEIILKINKENRPFTWTAVAYVQTYGKIKNKAYHINTQNFLLKYNPRAKFLLVPTQKIFIFVENFPNTYKGMDEWFYRWRREIQDNLKTWISIYTIHHSNIRVYDRTQTVTVYEIDNSSYIKYLGKKAIR